MYLQEERKSRVHYTRIRSCCSSLHKPHILRRGESATKFSPICSRHLGFSRTFPGLVTLPLIPLLALSHDANLACLSRRICKKSELNLELFLERKTNQVTSWFPVCWAWKFQNHWNCGFRRIPPGECVSYASFCSWLHVTKFKLHSKNESLDTLTTNGLRSISINLTLE